MVFGEGGVGVTEIHYIQGENSEIAKKINFYKRNIAHG